MSHSTRYVDALMRTDDLPSSGHDIGARFTVNEVSVEVTPADHAWQNDAPDAAGRVFEREDCRLLRQ